MTAKAKAKAKKSVATLSTSVETMEVVSKQYCRIFLLGVGKLLRVDQELCPLGGREGGGRWGEGGLGTGNILKFRCSKVASGSF